MLISGFLLPLPTDHCHICGVLHRDLKLENILLSADKSILISDFGLGRTYEVSAFIPVASPCLQPEARSDMLNRKNVNISNHAALFRIKISAQRSAALPCMRRRSWSLASSTRGRQPTSGPWEWCCMPWCAASPRSRPRPCRSFTAASKPSTTPSRFTARQACLLNAWHPALVFCPLFFEHCLRPPVCIVYVISADFKDLIRKIFVKNTAERITMDDLRLHPVCSPSRTWMSLSVLGGGWGGGRWVWELVVVLKRLCQLECGIWVVYGNLIHILAFVHSG